MYEGEVTELTPEYTEAQTASAGGGYGKVVSHVIIGLKTVKGTKQLKLDPAIYDGLQKEKVGAAHRSSMQGGLSQVASGALLCPARAGRRTRSSLCACVRVSCASTLSYCIHLTLCVCVCASTGHPRRCDLH